MGVDERGEPLGDGEAGTRGRQPRVPSQGGPAGHPAGVPAQRAWREREEDDGPPAVAGRAPSDAELITRMRAGDDTAYEELYRRHAEAVRRYARTCCRDAHTADDLTAEVFARVLQAVRRGSGPEHAVRAYLLTTVRRVAAHWTKTARREQLVDDFALFADQAAGLTKGSAEDASQLGAEVRALREAERSMAMRAFRSLPERWQAVLWHTEVEDESPSEVATLFGLDANGTRVLASRAREGLRQAYLQAHVSDALATDEECARYADQLGGYARRKLRTRAERGLREHLEECARCRLAALQIEEVASGIPAVVPVAVIGWFGTAGYAKALAVLTGTAGAAGAAAGATAGGGTAGGGTAVGGAAGSGATAGGGAVGGSSGGAGGGSAAAEGLGAPVKAGIAAGVVAVATAAVALALAGHGSPARKPVAAPPPASAPAAEPQSPTPTPPPTPQPTPPKSSPIGEPGPKPPVRPAAAKPAPIPAPEPSPTPTPTPTLSPPRLPTPTPAPTTPPPPAPSTPPAPTVHRWSELDYDLTGDGTRPEMPLDASSWVWQRYGMAIDGKRYTDGVTVHGESSVTIALNRPCTAYDAEAGVDDLTAGLGRVSFSVYADGVRLWRSGPVAAGQPAVPVHVNLAGRDTVRLVVEAPRVFDAVTLADWAESTFTCD
ncbi:sigma-70 family RNA polymerase sigma factor [Streptomyces anandii]|uniref:sigma-70 family RNA polymerase sigma factor n=1 Tax=Streptomyces anandii TaxID=285454 RepID=UPI0036B23479